MKKLMLLALCLAALVLSCKTVERIVVREPMFVYPDIPVMENCPCNLLPKTEFTPTGDGKYVVDEAGLASVIKNRDIMTETIACYERGIATYMSYRATYMNMRKSYDEAERKAKEGKGGEGD